MGRRYLTASDYVFYTINGAILVTFGVAALYPFLEVVFASLSDAVTLTAHTGPLLRPAGFSVQGYLMAFQYRGLLTGYANTVYYVVVGTALNVTVTGLLAYVLSTRALWKNVIMVMVVVTMFFQGGLIPRYLIVRSLGLLNTRWAVILPVMINTFNLIIMRTFFQGIPDSLEESAKIDGAKSLTIFIRIIVPLSGPVIAVMTLYYGVAHWNSWFNAMIFLRDRSLYPLQLFLREILIQAAYGEATGSVEEIGAAYQNVNEDILRNAFIVIATLPILCLYPFLQKYFVKGVMIGALKG